MGFSPDIKEKACIASARRCCVCKNFKGRNIEVHHIVQEADGGENTFENAIPLCFDCHAEAGHYNSRHPKGAKYSPSELKAHRDYWYQVVADGKISVESIHFTHQYYITNSFDIINEIVNGEFGKFPIDHIKLFQNKLFSFLKSACNFHKGLSREMNIGGNLYSSVEDYLSKHADAKQCESPWRENQWERIPTLEEVKQKFVPFDFVSNYMVKHGAPVAEIAKAIFTVYGCANSFVEEFILREAKVVFLALINTTDKELACKSISECVVDKNDFSEVGSLCGNLNETNLNNLSLSPGECLLIPSCIVLTPFSYDSYTPEDSIIEEYVDGGKTQDIRKVAFRDFEKYPTIGPYHQISSINLISRENSYCAELRPLLMNNLFLISRYWECGSCPHLFIQNKGSSKWLYMGEVFSRNPRMMQTYTIKRSNPKFSRVQKIIIMELERETTYIDKIVLDKKKILENITLKINEKVEIDVYGAESIEILGYYILHSEITYRNSTQIKYQKAYHMLEDINKRLPNNSLHRTTGNCACCR